MDDRQEPITETEEIFFFLVGSTLSQLLNHERCCHVASQTIAGKLRPLPHHKTSAPRNPYSAEMIASSLRLRLHGSKIGVCAPAKIVCKLSMLNPITYIFSESLLNIDSIFLNLFYDTDHKKQHQCNKLIMTTMLANFEFICKHVYLNT